MRKTALATLVAVGFGLAGAGGASAAPANGAAIAELGHLADQLIQVREGCGRPAPTFWTLRPRMRIWLVPALSAGGLPA
jgi:hypothetical protein